MPRGRAWSGRYRQSLVEMAVPADGYLPPGMMLQAAYSPFHQFSSRNFYHHPHSGTNWQINGWQSQGEGYGRYHHQRWHHPQSRWFYPNAGMYMPGYPLAPQWQNPGATPEPYYPAYPQPYPQSLRYNERPPAPARNAHHFYNDVQAPDEATLANSVRTVLQVAKELHMSEMATKTAIAIMFHESRGNPLARGDGDTSFGLFQLHEGGELTEAGLTPEQAFDPLTNARVAMRYIKHLEGQYADPGKLATAAQRPKDKVAFAGDIDDLMGTAEQLMRKYS